MTVPNYCERCRENLLPEQTECPFCGQMAVPIDHCQKGEHDFQPVWFDDYFMGWVHVGGFECAKCGQLGPSKPGPLELGTYR